MIEKFLNMMRQQASTVENGQARAVLGKIINYDPVSFYGMVELYAADPTDQDSVPLQSGWLPICMPAIGWYLAPKIGDLVFVQYQEGSLQNGFISLCCHTASPPSSIKSGEWSILHPSGSLLKFTNDGKVIVNGNLEIDLSAPTITINVTGAANITAGSVAIDSATINLGDLTGGTLQPLLNAAARTVYNSHTHPVGSGSTGAPDQQIPSSAETTNVLAT